MSRKFTVPIQLPADPTQPLEAATKRYVDAQVDVAVRCVFSRASATYPAGDTAIPVLTLNTNIGGFVSTTGVITIPVDGTYAFSVGVGGAALTAGTAVTLSVTGQSAQAFPAQAGTAWRCGGTMIWTVAAGASFSVTLRNAFGGNVAGILVNGEIVKIA